MLDGRYQTCYLENDDLDLRGEMYSGNSEMQRNLQGRPEGWSRNAGADKS